MSKASLPPQPRVIGGRKTLAIVASLYNEDFVNAMVDAARAEIDLLLPGAIVPLYRVPGAFEIPVCAQFVVERANVDVIVALGVIIRGETGHADLIAGTVAKSLQDLARETLVPVVNEVLLLDSEDQARERCFGTRMNRGTEAARVAVGMAELMQKLETTYPRGKSKA